MTKKKDDIKTEQSKDQTIDEILAGIPVGEETDVKPNVSVEDADGQSIDLPGLKIGFVKGKLEVDYAGLVEREHDTIVEKLGKYIDPTDTGRVLIKDNKVVVLNCTQVSRAVIDSIKDDSDIKEMKLDVVEFFGHPSLFS